MNGTTAPVLPTRPPVEGLSFRTYEGEHDLPAIVALLRAADAANGEEMVASIDRIRNHYRSMTRIDPREDVVLAFVDDRLVANSWIEWADTSYGERHFNSLGAVHPAWRGRGIGRAMMERNERRLREIAAGQVFAQAARLTTWFQDGDIGARALAERRGYQRVRVYHHMVRPTLDDIEVTPLPAGLELRRLTQDRLPAYWAGLCEAFRDHFGAWDDSESAYRSWVDGPLFDLDLQFVAFAGDEIAGGIHAAIDPVENEEHGYMRGWAEPIFTRRPWRRRGLASALLGRTLVALRERGMTSAQLHVDAENPNEALSLYERHGFHVHSSSSEWHKPLETEA
jgi:GNAT superfamily N-acetyltransferase